MHSLALMLATLAQTPAAEPWTWTLYADAPVVLANEIPDTARLRTTFECAPGSGVAKLTLYDGVGQAGMARVSSGAATAMAEASDGRRASVNLTLRTDHPVFAAFTSSGRLSVAVGERKSDIELGAEHMPALKRFAELCAG